MIITGIMMGEIKKIFSALLNSNVPLTNAKEAVVPKMREKRVVAVAIFRLNSVGSAQLSSVRNV
jgi:hypothetical protein